MKKILLVLFITASLLIKVKAQCSTNSLFTSLGVPGVFPPPFNIPGLPIGGINDGITGNYYSDTLTLVILEDTLLDISSLLPTTVVTAMNLAGISTTMSLAVNNAVFDILGLPNGISYACNQNNCEYLLGIDGCILIDGTPIQTGVFEVSVNMILNVQIPVIPNPIPGTPPIFNGLAIDLPSFSTQQYYLLINGATSLNENNSNSNLFPNPTSKIATLFLRKYSDIVVYNTSGIKVIVLNNIIGEIVFRKEDLGTGLFFINISSKNYNTVIKLIIE